MGNLPSMMFNKPDRDMPFFRSSSDCSFAFFNAFVRVATFSSFDPTSVVDAVSAAGSARIRPAVSISSNRTMQRAGRFVNNMPSSSSVNVGSRRETTWISRPNTPARAKVRELKVC